MATISDTIRTGGSVPETLWVMFTPCGAPYATVSGLLTGRPIPVRTSTSGAFTAELNAGEYEVAYRIPSGIERFRITVPDDDGTYTFADLVGGEAGAFGVTLAIPGWGALKSRTRHLANELVTMAFVDDPNDYGAGRTYIYDATSTAPEEKPNVAKPNNVSSENPGRWLWLTPWAAYKATDIKTYDSLTDFAAEKITAPVVFLVADGSGKPAHFERNDAASGPDDGVNIITNATGTRYTRLDAQPGPLSYLDFRSDDDIARATVTKLPGDNYTLRITKQ